MAKAKFDIKDLRSEATRTLYAGVGVADLAVEAVREYVDEAQKRLAEVRQDVRGRVDGVQKSVKGIDLEPKALRERATTVVNDRVEVLTKEAKARREAIEARVAELQNEARDLPARVQTALDANVATVTDTYADLAKRGETLLARIRRQEATQETVASAKATTVKAKTTRTQGAKATKATTGAAKRTTKAAAKKTTATAKKSAATPRSSAKATTTAAAKTVSAATEAATEAAKKVGD